MCLNRFSKTKGALSSMLDLLFTLDLTERHMKHVFNPPEPARTPAAPAVPDRTADRDDRRAAGVRLHRIARAAFAGGRAGR